MPKSQVRRSAVPKALFQKGCPILAVHWGSYTQRLYYLILHYIVYVDKFCNALCLSPKLGSTVPKALVQKGCTSLAVQWGSYTQRLSYLILHYIVYLHKFCNALCLSLKFSVQPSQKLWSQKGARFWPFSGAAIPKGYPIWFYIM